MHVLFLALSFALLLGPRVDEPLPRAQAPRRLVLLIADGFGPASLTLARSVVGRPLVMDGLLVGSCATGAADSRITDSAAAATALACCTSTRNLRLGVDPAGQQLSNLFERVRPLGLATGVVTTTRITHATPAAFTAHIDDRLREDLIAVQQLQSGTDLLLGGGRALFVPGVEGQLLRRPDGRDLLAEAAGQGWSLVSDLPGLVRAERLPLLGLFGASHLPYELDLAAPPDARPQAAPPDARPQDAPRTLPTLREMALAALRLLPAGGRDFVLVVEGGRIDHAAHDNDLAAHVGEILAYDEALAAVLDFANDDGRTLVVAVSDHETGGLTLGRNRDGQGVLDWDPSWLRRPRASVEAVLGELDAGLPPGTALRERLGIADASPAEVQRVAEAAALAAGPARRVALVDALAAPLALRSGTAWTTQGHTAVDVPLFASGPGKERLAGHSQLAALGQELWELLAEGHADSGR